MKKIFPAILVLILLFIGIFFYIKKLRINDFMSPIESEQSENEQMVKYTNTLSGTLCVPSGEAPFPAVIYNHGGYGSTIGGDPEGTCEALAEAGYVGFSPIRRATDSAVGHDEDVLDALTYLQGLDYVDSSQMAMIGFSRGGLLTYMLATQDIDMDAYVLMAPAPGGQDNLYDILDDAVNISAPVLLMVSENDLMQADHVQIVADLEEALLTANKEVEVMIYPPYGDDGHYMFFEISDYWTDVLDFLESNI